MFMVPICMLFIAHAYEQLQRLFFILNVCSSVSFNSGSLFFLLELIIEQSKHTCTNAKFLKTGTLIIPLWHYQVLLRLKKQLTPLNSLLIGQKRMLFSIRIEQVLFRMLSRCAKA